MKHVLIAIMILFRSAPLVAAQGEIQPYVLIKYTHLCVQAVKAHNTAKSATQSKSNSNDLELAATAKKAACELARRAAGRLAEE